MGEQCDCGRGDDPCCECSTCQLKPNNTCASGDSCCESCQVKGAGAICRDAVSECDIAETCDGENPWCPPDDGITAGAPCGDGSDIRTCYAKECTMGLGAACDKRFGQTGMQVMESLDEYSVADLVADAAADGWSAYSACNALNCCDVIEGCSRYSASSSWSFDGVETIIHLGGAPDGAFLPDPPDNSFTGGICIQGKALPPLRGDCGAAFGRPATFHDKSVGRCLPCHKACGAACYGPAATDCGFASPTPPPTP